MKILDRVLNFVARRSVMAERERCAELFYRACVDANVVLLTRNLVTPSTYDRRIGSAKALFRAEAAKAEKQS